MSFLQERTGVFGKPHDFHNGRFCADRRPHAVSGVGEVIDSVFYVGLCPFRDVFFSLINDAGGEPRAEKAASTG